MFQIVFICLLDLFLVGSLFDFDTDIDDSVEQCKNAKVQNITFSLAQDLIYNATGGKNWTPKHIGLASTLHQTTRSKELVQLFHNAGHAISYENVLQVDNALAESTLKSMNTVNGAVVPPNLVANRFLHFTCDNIDINDSSLESCQEIIACKYKSGCKTLRCRCKKSNLNWTRDCTCSSGSELCHNHF